MRLLLFLSAFIIGSQAQSQVVNPEWATSAVWYQIFPERFCNGDTTNDPTVATLKGSYPHDEQSAWQIHPWTSDWYVLQPYEQENKKNIGFNIQRRRYGGDLQGIINKLDYLKNLGVNSLYLTPIFYAPSSHKYDAICYHHVDPYFGPNPTKDLATIATETPDDPATWHWTEADKLALQLISEVHKRGMRIIFDGVWNHMGIENLFMKDIVAKGEKSKYANWFYIKEWNTKGDMNMPFKYQSWFGVKELPELREDENGIVSGPREYIFNCTKRWMQPDGNVNAGIDGWRLDVAYCINLKFWSVWNAYVHQLNPQSYTTAEIVDPPLEVKRYLDAGFNAVMNYNFGFAAHDYFINQKLASNAAQLDSKNKEMLKVYGKSMYVMQNLYDSHDAQRLASATANPDIAHFAEWGIFFGMTQAEHNGNYNSSKPTPEQRRTQKLMVAYQMCMPGAPMFLYGDEAGMWGANDPDCRKPMVWADKQYDAERTDPKGKISRNDGVKFDTALFNYYKTWIDLRNQHPVLSQGTYKLYAAIDSAGILIIERTWEKETVYILINRSEKDYDFKFQNGSKSKNALTKLKYDMMLGTNPLVSFSKREAIYKLPAKSIAVLKKR